MKRLLDLIVSVPLFLLFFPSCVLIGFAIRRNIGSPIIFKQERPGLNCIPFYLYKFRTMKDTRDEHGRLLPDDVRLTSFGKFLRKYSLDELPQLINVIKGDISLVGPRPLLIDYLSLYSKEQLKRHNVKPGITGWAQVNGRNAISWEKKFELDIWYVKNQSFLLDIKILAMTVIKVIRAEGINQAGQTTIEKFRGSTSVVKGGK